MHSLKLILSNFRYFSVVWVFCSLNIIIGTWVLYIPRVKEKLQLNDSEIGFALFCLALGLLLFIPLVPFLTRTFGLGKCTFFGICLFSVAFIGPLIATSYILLCVSLFVVGIFSGITDIAMNTLVSEMEQKDAVNFMSSAHGFFSLGGAIGALVGFFLLGVFESPLYHILLMAFFVIIINLGLAKHYFNITEQEEIKDKGKSKIPSKVIKPLIILAFLALVIMSSEGAVEHWSAIYLIEIVQVSSGNLAGLGFTVFSITMTLGRFFGDRISEKIGSEKIIILGCVMACVGYLSVLVGQLFFSVFGFGIIGLGLSVVIPEIFRVAGKTKGISASKSISFVSGVGFIGFLLGPVIIGLISNTYNLKISFMALFF